MHRLELYYRLMGKKDKEIEDENERCRNGHKNIPKLSERLGRMKWERHDIFMKIIDLENSIQPF